MSMKQSIKGFGYSLAPAILTAACALALLLSI